MSDSPDPSNEIPSRSMGRRLHDSFLRIFGGTVILIAAVTTAFGQDDELGVGGLVVISLAIAMLILGILKLRDSR